MARRTATYAIRLAVEGVGQVKAELVSVDQSAEGEGSGFVPILFCATTLRKTLCRPVRRASAFGQSREAVGAPAFTAHAVMDEEEALGIVLVLHGEQLCVVRAPKALPPRRFE